MTKIIRAASVAASIAAALLLSSEVKAAITPQGFVTAREWLCIGGTTLDYLTNLTTFPDSPDVEDYAPRFEWPTGPVGDDNPPPGDVQSYYGVQLTGYFIPTQTGTYRFAISADDNALVYLSTDSNPANKVRIAIEAGWNQVRNFDGQYNGRALVDVGTPDERWDNQSKPIQLTAGQAYYIEGQLKEGGGGDNLAVAYKTDGTWPIAGDLPIPGTELATIDKTSGPVSIATQPQSQTIQEGTPLYLAVVADGTPPYTYQWKKDGTDITDATNRTYSIAFASRDDTGSYTVTVSGGQGAPVTSTPAVITVNTDTTKPTIVQVIGSGDFKHVTVIYSERIEEASGTNAASYTIGGPGGVAVSSGRLLSDTTVELTTSVQTSASSYTLTVNNVRDRAFTPNTIAANTRFTISSAQLQTGIANWERWQDVGGDTADIDTFVANLADPNFRGPDLTGVSSYLGSPHFGNGPYGTRAFCYFVPPTTTDYVFFLACDDRGYLYLSTDNNPANKKLIAAQPSWGDTNQWIDPDTTENRSDMFSTTEWPTGNTIHLTQGTQYYMEGVLQAHGAGDHLEVTHKLSTDADPANGTASIMTGTNIVSYVGVPTPPISISKGGTGTSVTYEGTLQSAPGVTGPYSDVPGATSPYPVTTTGTQQYYRSKQ